MRAHAKKNKAGYTVKLSLGSGDTLSISTLADADSLGKTTNYLMEQIKMMVLRELRSSIEVAEHDFAGTPPPE